MCIFFPRIVLDKIHLGSSFFLLEYQISMWIDASRTHEMVELGVQLESHVAESYELATISMG